MTKIKAMNWAKENGYNPEKVVSLVRDFTEKCGTNWASVTLKKGSHFETKRIKPGYRKCTTGEYVPNSYLANFGWKNTYYQSSVAEITLPRSLNEKALREVKEEIND